ncbi:acyl-CoA dehydrogenase [Oleomonas cavernae]|uniref:Acyl-CoA dehydrogenase n=1 Tax=Oleomonas cavernae TaxID=2320859 RepID=A0A418WEA2_9PROT|nr:acyl-CoA dehydrogenase [Oleomonas cavernae]RJF88269.1 acyl-CoA dehydrogenase [Oleomonas cavernae]
MDLTYTPGQQAFRADVRAWMAANVPAHKLKSYDTREGFEEHRAWERTLNEGRYAMITWPEILGGRGANLIEWLIFEEEYYRAGAPGRVNQNGIFLLGPTLMEYGTPEQKARFLPRMAAGEDIWAQGWSEPGAGSDMAAIRTKAVRDGDHYVINGQKTWSTRAAFADWCFGLFRTDPNSERHHGMSFILLPLDTPGITRRPIPQLDGEPGFAELFFDDVRVPVENRLGGEGEGWNIAMATAGFERGLMLRSPARFQETAKRLVTLYRRHQAKVSPAVGEAVLKAWMDAEAYCLNTYMTASRLMAGGKIGQEASLNKIFWSELDRSMHETALSILGARAELLANGVDDPDEATRWLKGFLFSLAGPIYAGTNEIQRNVIAERLLKLPR